MTESELRGALTLEGLRDWVLTQDPETAYDYTNGENCLIARYLRGLGFEGVQVYPLLVTASVFSMMAPRNIEGVLVPLDRRLNDVSLGATREDGDWVYWRALGRIDEILEPEEGS